MKAQFTSRYALVFGFLLVAASVLVGCSSTRRIDWDSRVGNYTYDQAVSELGPPDKTAKLSDGKTVADWITGTRSGGLSVGVGRSSYSGGRSTGVGVGTSTGSTRDRVLRLTFDTDNRLIDWSKD